MYYKVIKDGRIIDVIRDVEIVYIKYQERYDRFIFCDISEAQAIFSPDRKHVWHIDGLYDVPNGVAHDCVELVGIDSYEYEQLKIYDMQTIEEVIDKYTLTLIQGGVI